VSPCGYPITFEEGGQKDAFRLIAGSDHPEAPRLMDRAYLDVCGDRPDVDPGRQKAINI
jgi:hypothetical protein